MEEGKWKWNVRWEVNRIRVSVMCVSCVCHVCVMCGVGCTPVLLLLIVVHCIHKFACNRTVNECQIIHKQHTNTNISITANANTHTKSKDKAKAKANASGKCYCLVLAWVLFSQTMLWDHRTMMWNF